MASRRTCFCRRTSENFIEFPTAIACINSCEWSSKFAIPSTFPFFVVNFLFPNMCPLSFYLEILPGQIFITFSISLGFSAFLEICGERSDSVLHMPWTDMWADTFGPGFCTEVKGFCSVCGRIVWICTSVTQCLLGWHCTATLDLCNQFDTYRKN